jgi:hypothetical protein
MLNVEKSRAVPARSGATRSGSVGLLFFQRSKFRIQNSATAGRWTTRDGSPTIFFLFNIGAADMAEEAPMDTTAAAGTMQVMVDERDMKTHYANAYRIHATSDEVVIDLGFNMPDPGKGQGQPAALLLKVTDRVVFNYSNTKRLAQSLTQLIKRYEQHFGELPSPGARQTLK